MWDMKKINVLPPQIFNLLSAGEVVENPSSVIKECVENSIDAGATSIDVAIIDGGLTEIIITDNGEGIAESEIEKVFLPHATSKISKADDLDAISTLGFRGEAMSSIAQVAKLSLASKTAEQDIATKIDIEAGEIVRKEKISSNVGTSLRVANLFYNTPARRKFLGSESKEKSNVTNVINNLILANPCIKFRYSINGEIFYDYQGDKLINAIELIYGKECVDNIIHVQSDKLCGFISIPSYTKRNRTYQTIMINGRVVQGGIVADAVNEVFKTYMINGNFPFFVLDLNIDFRCVDVNIHPRKAQVRFEDEEGIFQYVKQSISDTIDNYLHERNRLLMKKDQSSDVIQKKTTYLDEFDKIDKQVLSDVKFFAASGEPQKVKGAPNIMNALEKKYFDNEPDESLGLFDTISPGNVIQEKIEDNILGDDIKVLGTIFDCYVLVTSKERFFIIDQHAAHEKLIFDELRSNIDKEDVARQELVEPYIMYLTPSEYQKMEEYIEPLNNVGFSLNFFGNNNIRISSVPLSLGSGHDVKLFFGKLLADIKTPEKKTSKNKLEQSSLIEDKIILMSCKSAIKSGHILTKEQIAMFLTQFKDGMKMTCPHGRPVILTFTRNEVEKLFSRK